MRDFLTFFRGEYVTPRTLLIAAVTALADGDAGRGLFVFIVAGAVLTHAGMRIYRRNAGRPDTPGSAPPPPGDPEAR